MQFCQFSNIFSSFYTLFISFFSHSWTFATCSLSILLLSQVILVCHQFSFLSMLALFLSHVFHRPLQLYQPSRMCCANYLISSCSKLSSYISFILATPLSPSILVFPFHDVHTRYILSCAFAIPREFFLLCCQVQCAITWHFLLLPVLQLSWLWHIVWYLYNNCSHYDSDWERKLTYRVTMLQKFYCSLQCNGNIVCNR